MSEEKLKNIRLGLHLKYSIIICLIISCIVGGFALYNQKMAISGLSNAGLLLSIVLAVIAILMSLWDVSGQRNSVYEIKEQMQLIKKITDEIKDSSVNSKEILEKLEDVDKRFSMDFEPIKNAINQMNEKLESSPNEVDELRKIANKITNSIKEKEEEQIVIKKNFEGYNKTNSIEVSEIEISRFISSFIKRKGLGEKFSVQEIVLELLGDYPSYYGEDIVLDSVTVSIYLDALAKRGRLEKVSDEIYRRI